MFSQQNNQQQIVLTPKWSHQLHSVIIVYISQLVYPVFCISQTTHCGKSLFSGRRAGACSRRLALPPREPRGQCFNHINNPQTRKSAAIHCGALIILYTSRRTSGLPCSTCGYSPRSWLHTCCCGICSNTSCKDHCPHWHNCRPHPKPWLACSQTA